MLRLIQVAENKPPTWLTEDEILVLIRAGVKFMDVTEDQKGVTAVAKKTRGKQRRKFIMTDGKECAQSDR